MSPEYLFGTAGWSYPDWVGPVYAAKPAAQESRLAFLSRYFDLVEINASFYAPLAPAQCRRWLEETRPDFLFTAKLWQRFTHERGAAAEEDHLTYTRGVAPLASAGRLAGLLIQFPWSFRCTADNGHYLDELLSRYRALRPSVELRHGSWESEETMARLAAAGAGLVNLDQPAHRDGIPLRAAVCGDSAYFRLHGRNAANWFDRKAGRDGRYDYLYSPTELDEVAAALRSTAQRAQRILVIGNNHFRGSAVANVLQLKAMILGRKVTAPPRARATFPCLEAVSVGEEDPTAQGELFVRKDRP
jgi:uncharacterized protein YecE (DUF72 family)